MLRVGVLGQLTVEVDGSGVELPTSRRARALLGLLAIERRTHSRSQLAARFWPDVLDESARTSLRAALSALRKVLGPDADGYLLAGRDTVALAGEALVWTDIAEFESLVAAGRSAEALALSRGELLEGLDDEWILHARDEQRDRVVQALGRLAADAEASGELREAAALTRRQIALDPLAEEPSRELIRRLAAAGDRPAALTAYRRLQDRLRSDLGIAPSAQTRELVDSVRTSTPQPTDRVTHPAGTVTLLFTDQVSSTETLAHLGDDEAARRRRAHFRLLSEVATSHRGHEVKNLGDGVMVAFASAVDAVACAIAIQQVVQRHTESERGGGLMVRVGLNAGEPFLDDGDYFGTPVVVAKRLCDAARGGQILATDLVRGLVGNRGGFEFRPVGPVALKGLPAPVTACEVGWEAAAQHPIPLPAAVLGAESSEFVGRGEILSELDRQWTAAVAGERRVALLAGEPGIGKTRLAAEFCRRAHSAGAAVLAGRCHEEMVTPYAPFAEALRHYATACPPAELAVHLSPWRRELAVLVPELGDGRSISVAESPPEAEQERFRLLEAIAALLAGASLARPLILLVDDLHWADDASLLLLRHVVRATEDSRLLVLGTYRQTELDRQGPLAAALAELRRARVLAQIPVPGLSEAEVAALIAARTGAGADEGFAHQVSARTDGNPFFIEELLRHVEDRSGAGLDAADLPAGVKDLLLRRLRRLGPESEKALVFAAVSGREFELDVLARVLGVPDEGLAELLERAIAAHVLVEEAGSIGRYRFAHPLIREAIYGEVSATRRALAHRRIAEAIESVGADRLSGQAGALALHYHAAGDAEKALHYHDLAAAEAERAGAPETALEHLTGAIAAGELLGRTVGADATMRDLHCRRGAMGYFSASHEVMRRDYRLALEGAREVGDRTLEIDALNGLGFSFHIIDSDASARYHGQALELAEQVGDATAQVIALGRLSLLGANQLDLEGALTLGERALGLAEGSGDEAQRSRALDCLKFVALLLGQTDRLEALTAQLTQAQRRRQDTWFLQWTLLESAFTPTVQGRWSEAAARLDEALAISRRMDDVYSRGLILGAQCVLEHARGDYVRAFGLGEAAFAAISRDAAGVWMGWTAATVARPLADLRAWDRARDLLEAGAEASAKIDARGQSFSLLGDLGWVRLQLGDEPGARAAAQHWDDLARRMRTPPGDAYLYSAHTYTSRAQVALALGDLDRAQAILAALREPVRRFGLREAAANVHAGLAACAAARGERSTAHELLEAGLRAAGDDGWPATRLALRLALARLASSEAGRDEHARAAQALIEQIARSVGDEPLRTGFRAAVAGELETAAPVGAYAAGASRQVTS